MSCPTNEVSSDAASIAAALKTLSDEELLYLAEDLVELGFVPQDFMDEDSEAEDEEDIESSLSNVSKQ